VSVVPCLCLAHPEQPRARAVQRRRLSDEGSTLSGFPTQFRYTDSYANPRIVSTVPLPEYLLGGVMERKCILVTLATDRRPMEVDDTWLTG